ncbi:MAG: hypothetical protein E7629_04570 [Ruminococcaceae bacterium]|nr:hypothetical protein [Oscillospiraceae bacterium]
MKSRKEAEKGMSTVKTAKGFDQTFSKVCAVEAAEASSPVATGEIPRTAFSLLTFFCACGVKRKWLTSLRNPTICDLWSTT